MTSATSNDLLDELQRKREQEWYMKVTGRDINASFNEFFVPEAWLRELPEDFEKTEQYSLYVDDEVDPQVGLRRAFGLIANFETCYMNIDGYCFTAPPVEEHEDFAYQGNVKTAEGNLVPVTIIAATLGHPESPNIYENVLYNQGWVDDKFQPLKNSTDIMAHQLLFGRFKNAPQGIAFLGAAFPHVQQDMVQRINASAISGQWQYNDHEQKYVLTGPVFVNKGALPLKNKQNIQLRNIAASYGYNLIMGVDTSQESETCACQDLVSAAQDPTPPQAITGTEEVINEDITIDDVVFAHTGQIAALEKAVILLEKEVARLVAKDEEAV